MANQSRGLPRDFHLEQRFTGKPMPLLDLSSFRWITFDCYGTLIDWETGIKEALLPILSAHGVSLENEPLLELYAELEAELEADTYGYIPYREVLAGVVAGFGKRLAFVPTRDEMHFLADSLPNWQPFPDTLAALDKLKRKYKLGIISNTDDDLFLSTARVLKVPFDEIVTAQQSRSYKPSLRNFQLAIERIGVPSEEILHVAQSIYHDVVPSRTLGIASAWVNRRSARKGAGATKVAFAAPDLEVPDLQSLALMAS